MTCTASKTLGFSVFNYSYVCSCRENVDSEERNMKRPKKRVGRGIISKTERFGPLMGRLIQGKGVSVGC